MYEDLDEKLYRKEDVNEELIELLGFKSNTHIPEELLESFTEEQKEELKLFEALRKNYTKEEIIKQRREKFLNIGKEKTLTVFSKKSNWILRNNFFNIIKKFKKELIVIVLLIAAITFLI